MGKIKKRKGKTTMKKKVLTLCLVVALAATAIIGGTMAYFTDKDAQKNTFTTGNVAIDLFEDFGDNDATGIEKLVPAVGSAQDGTLKNGIEKEVYVENTGSEDAYVRVHIAIPAVLDDGDPTFNAGNNVLHFNYSSGRLGNSVATIGADKWNWSKTHGEPYDGNWNFYTTTIDDILYNVYVVTYEKALAKNEGTCDAINQVYLDSKVTNEDITKIKNGDASATTDAAKRGLGDNWYIYVAAEGAQAAGFDNAYDALNTAFGTPGNYSVDWKTVSGKTWVDTTSANGK